MTLYPYIWNNIINITIINIISSVLSVTALFQILYIYIYIYCLLILKKKNLQIKKIISFNIRLKDISFFLKKKNNHINKHFFKINFYFIKH